MSPKPASVPMGITLVVVILIASIGPINAGCTFQPGYSPSSYTTICTLGGIKMGRLDWQSDGNLVIYNEFNGAAVWSTSTSGNPNARLTFQADGNLVIYGGNNNLLWSSGTAGSGQTLNFQDDGNLVIYDAHAAVWSSGIFFPKPPGALCVYRKGFTFPANAVTSPGVCSQWNCHFQFYQGRLVVVRDDSRSILWQTSPAGTRATFQSDGNLVVYIGNGNNAPVWSSSTFGTGNSLIFKDNCDLVVSNAAGQPVWHSGSVLAACDCDYYGGGGCAISHAAPTGYKCHCNYPGFWSCNGDAVACANGQVTGECDGVCTSKNCCIAGGGDCGGYGN